MEENSAKNTDQGFGELKGTSISMSQSQGGLSDLDSMIAETLNESKLARKPEILPKETLSLAATPISKETLKETHAFAVEHKRTIPVQDEVKQPQKMPPAPLPASGGPLAEQAPSPTGPATQKAAAKPEAPKDPYGMTFKQYSPGDVIKGTIVKIDQTGALVDIQYKSDGFINSDELSDRKLKVGEIIDVYIDAISTKEGHVALSIKHAEIELDWKNLYESFKQKKSVETKVTSAVAGGLVVDYKGIRGFVPASHVTKKGETSLSDFVEKTIPVQVIEIDRRRSKVIMSHRFGNIEKQQHDKELFFDHIEVGSVLHGTVSSIKKFGAFINVNGIEGLLHINEMSWKRIVDPNKIVRVGQDLDVFVIGVDKQSRKLSLGLKELQVDPWATALEKYKAGQIVEVKILRLAKFGAFAELEEGLEGLIHNSELSSKPTQNASEIVKAGDIVKVVILRIIPEEQKISLSIKEVELEEEKEEYKKNQEAHPQKITIGDAISENMKEHLTNQPVSTADGPESLSADTVETAILPDSQGAPENTADKPQDQDNELPPTA